MDLKFHESCRSIYACLLSLDALGLTQSTSTVVPSLLLIFTLTKNQSVNFLKKEVCKTNLGKSKLGNTRHTLCFLLEYLKFVARSEVLPTVRPQWKVYLKEKSQTNKLNKSKGLAQKSSLEFMGAIPLPPLGLTSLHSKGWVLLTRFMSSLWPLLTWSPYYSSHRIWSFCRTYFFSDTVADSAKKSL